MSKKLKDFTVSVKIVLDTDFSIKAESMEDALVKAKEVGLLDVVAFDGGYNDGTMEITGVFK